ncbi:MAG: hypothetical protein K9M10_01985 [Candidatus Pacebacteria bacterium]|nr:hypothetical protein [Candidatus Paceibacterota bacterium]MCF7857234.1 hypothetical protein [Candidatus Paceibacterota bacterium]
MNYKKLLIFSITAIIIFFPNNQSSAYFTTAQNEILLNDGSGLFLIEYSFSNKKNDISMPILAQESNSKNRSFLEYSIFNSQGETVSGKTTAIVLSNAQILDSRLYKIPKGTFGTFTLAVVFTPEIKDKKEKYRLEVTSLPFDFIGQAQLQLNPSELQYYTTKFLRL